MRGSLLLAAVGEPFEGVAELRAAEAPDPVLALPETRENDVHQTLELAFRADQVPVAEVDPHDPCRPDEGVVNPDAGLHEVSGPYANQVAGLDLRVRVRQKMGGGGLRFFDLPLNLISRFLTSISVR